MNSSQLKCFLTAAECLSFTRAADRLYMSQPVLSRQIAAMEDELGMELFIREKKTIRLSRAGKIMAEGLAQLNGEYQTLLEKARAVHMGYAGSLNIGMVEGQLICPPQSTALDRFHQKHPDVHVNLSRHTMAGVRSAVINGEVDIAFTALSELYNDDDEFDYITVNRLPTLLAIPKTHKLASRDNLRLMDFKDETFLTLPEGESQHIAHLPEYMEKIAFRPRTLEAPDIGTLALWLEAGYGIFGLNGNHSLRFNPNLMFVPLPEYSDVTEIVMWKKNSRHPAISMLIEQFADIAQAAK